MSFFYCSSSFFSPLFYFVLVFDPARGVFDCLVSPSLVLGCGVDSLLHKSTLKQVSPPVIPRRLFSTPPFDFPGSSGAAIVVFSFPDLLAGSLPSLKAVSPSASSSFPNE